MPRVPDKILSSVFYLYDDEESARKGSEFGGTGFLVAYPSERFPDQLTYFYAVSNWHVACRGSSVIRLNKRSGGSDVIPLGPEDWEFFPDLRYDLAVAIMSLNLQEHDYTLIHTDMFVKKEEVANRHLGAGEDVFMVGRFVDHDGGAVNKPAVRFGHISVMPTSIEQPTETMAEAFCIDVHSRSGYSGSPVFVYRTPGYDLEPRAAGSQPALLTAGVNYFGLLGIHFSQFKELWEVTEKSAPAEAASREPLITTGKYIQGLSGMTCILPAWTILEILNLPKLKRLRAEHDEMRAPELATNVSRSGAESALPASDAVRSLNQKVERPPVRMPIAACQ